MRVRKAALPLVVLASLLAQTAGALAAPASTLAATYQAQPPASMFASTAAQIQVTVTNTGDETWIGADVAGARYTTSLSYHWYDASGNVLVWDGDRSALGFGPIDPGKSKTVTASVRAPAAAGSYTLRFALVQEGVAWFGASQPFTVGVSEVRYAAAYTVGATAATYIGEQRQLPVTVTNTGNVPWNAANPVNLSYHVYTAKDAVVVWDGPRAALGDVAVGASKQVLLSYQAPTAIGDYVLAIDAVREGVAWLSSLGSPAVRLPMRVDSGYSVGYGATTTPALATIGAQVSLSVAVNNYGPRTLVAGGPNPVHLSYHLLDSSGSVVVWDGLRAALPGDIPAGSSASVAIDVQLPSVVGTYTIAWDLVQEGVAWLSQLGLPQKRETVSVQPGVTFYGKGFGHGLGMSQWGAQGMATGAGGTPPKTGEQIAAYYYPGTTLSPIPSTGPNTVIRVLLSQPSSQGRYSCGAAYFAGSLVNVVSEKGFRVLNEGAGNAVLFTAGPTVSVQIYATNNVVQVWDQATSTPSLVYGGAGPVVVQPVDPAWGTTILEKGKYRGNFRFTNLGNTLRVVDVASYDDYVRGVVPLEMLKDWSLEAYKAQAIAARTYAYNSYQGGARDYDVLDDQSDQCYGGVVMKGGRVIETDITNRAVDLTAGEILTYNGQAIRAYFASSDGGYTTSLGCWQDNVIASPAPPRCSTSPVYLTAQPDPWDLAVTQPNPNPNRSWTRTFTSDDIRSAVLAMKGIDIGTLLSVDLSNRQPAVVGHVISVKIVGTRATVDLPADRLLRDRLGLKSTMVRLAPW